MKLVPPLTARRIQVEAVVLAVFVWGNLLLGMAVSGQFSDFFQFYVQGAIALQRNPGLLYDIAGQTVFAQGLLPQARDFPCEPTVPPQISVLFSVFARMSYGHAELLWLLITCAGYALCCYALWDACPNLRRYSVAVALAAAAFPGLLFLIKYGQTTVIALAAFTWAFYCFRRERLFVAGLAIGLLAYKPQLGLVAAGIFLLMRAWRLVAGALVTGLGQYVLACWWYRKLVVLDWLRYLKTGIYGQNEHLMHSLLAFWRVLLPSLALVFPLYIVSAVVVFLFCLRVWKSASPLPLRFSAFLLATVLVDPHLLIYDLVVLVPALMLLVDWRLGSPAAPRTGIFTALLYLTYGLPLLVDISQHGELAFGLLRVWTPMLSTLLSVFSVAVSGALFGFLYLESTAGGQQLPARPGVFS